MKKGTRGKGRPDDVLLSELQDVLLEWVKRGATIIVGGD